MGRSPGFTTTPETKATISASMKSRMAEKFPVENRRGFNPKRKGPKPFTDEQKAASRERKNQRDRMNRKLTWYSEYKAAA